MGRGVPNGEERSIVCGHDGTDPILTGLAGTFENQVPLARGYDDETNLVGVRGICYVGDALAGEWTDGAIHIGDG
jgi:hypothetical protein